MIIPPQCTAQFNALVRAIDQAEYIPRPDMRTDEQKEAEAFAAACRLTLGGRDQ